MQNTNLSPEGLSGATQRLLDLDRLAWALGTASDLSARSPWSWDDREDAERVERVLLTHGVVVRWGGTR